MASAFDFSGCFVPVSRIICSNFQLLHLLTQDDVRRKMLEETGLEFEPTTLLSVEVIRGHWFRFTFIGNVTGINKIC